MWRFILFFTISSFLFVHSNGTWAQNINDTLKEVKIISPKVPIPKSIKEEFLLGLQKSRFDSTTLGFYQEFSLSDLIAEQSSVFVKSYGVNNMATLSIRGASAAQSQVLWNGVPINNAAVGISDVSLLRVGMFDDINIQYGGASALLGSGTVGGALLLDNNLPTFHPQKEIFLNIGGGSYGHQANSLGFDWQNKNWHFGMKGFYEKSRNDFLYKNNKGETAHLTNSDLSGAGFLFNTDYKFNQKQGSKIKEQTLSAKLWYQTYDREIPPALFESDSKKEMRNYDLHSLLEWQQKRERSQYYARFSYNFEQLNYQDSLSFSKTRNRVHQIYGEVGWKWAITEPEELDKWQQNLLLFSPFQYAIAKGVNQNKAKRTQWRPAVAAAYNVHSPNSRLSLNLSLRTEWWDHKKQIWLPGLNGEVELYRNTGMGHDFTATFLGSVQRSFRVPNLDELFFEPGGNPNLRPERGWNEDAGLSFNLQLSKDRSNPNQSQWALLNKTSYFNRNIKDWIYWLGGAIWTPHNLAKVHSRGIETESEVKWNKGDWGASLALKTAYVLATTTASYMPNDGSIGKQIPYTPIYDGMGKVGISWTRLLFFYSQNYTGYRFVTTDESQSLKPYQVGNFMLSYAFNYQEYSIGISAQLRNVWNRDYQVVNGRPMPGRNFWVSIRFGWVK